VKLGENYMPMSYAEALEWIKKQENGTDAFEAVQAHSASIGNGEKEYRRKLREAEATLQRFKDAAGSDEDVDKLLKELRSQVEALTKERDELKTNSDATIKELDDLKALSVKYERDRHFRDVAAKTGADYEAFASIFSDIAVENVIIKDDNVTIKDKDNKEVAFSEFLERIEGWKRRALFPSESGTQQQETRSPLPTGSSSNSPTSPTSQASSYIAANYGRFNKATT
jgi:seryl-tRNA synthetase